jgi:hypothetical protein
VRSVSAGHVDRRRASPFIQAGRDRKGCPLAQIDPRANSASTALTKGTHHDFAAPVDSLEGLGPGPGRPHADHRLQCRPAVATTYTIGILFDDRKDNGNCSLHEALRAADSDVTVDACPAGVANDTIILPSGTYNLSGHEALAGGGYLTIRSATGNALDVTVDLQGAGRFLALTGGGTYYIAGLTVVNGAAGVGDGNGCAIRAAGVTLTIDNLRFGPPDKWRGLAPSRPPLGSRRS